MVYVALAQTLVILALVYALVSREREADKAIFDVVSADSAERSELLNRIQRPDFVPVKGTPMRSRPAKDAGELAKIGTIAPPSNHSDDAA